MTSSEKGKELTLKEVAERLERTAGELASHHKEDGDTNNCVACNNQLREIMSAASTLRSLVSKENENLKKLRAKVQKRRDYLECITTFNSTDYRSNQSEILGLDWVLENVF